MAIIYAGGSTTNTTITATSQQNVLNALNAALTAVGWTSTFYNRFVSIIYTNQPANNNTIAAGGTTYTAKTVLTGAANEFLIGATAKDTYDNLCLAINLGPGIGTLYGTGTVVNANITAQNWTDGSFTLQSKTTGFAAPLFALTNSLTNTTNGGLSLFTTGAAGYRWDSAVDPVTGLQMSVLAVDQGSADNQTGVTQIRLLYTQTTYNTRSHIPMSTAATNNNGCGVRLLASGGTTLRVIANRYGFYVFQDLIAKASITSTQWFAAQLVYVYPGQRALTIQSVFNSGGVVGIETSTAHGYTSGDNVCTRGISLPATAGFFGNANVTSQPITVLDTTRFTIPIPWYSAMAGGIVAKVSGVGTVRQIAEAAYINGSDNLNTFGRVQLRGTNSVSMGWAFNGNVVNSTAVSTGVGMPMFMMPAPAAVTGCNTKAQLLTGAAIWTEPIITMGYTAAGTAIVIGQLYSHFIWLESIAPDIVGPADGNNFYSLTDTNGGTSAAATQGTLMVQV